MNLAINNSHNLVSSAGLSAGLTYLLLRCSAIDSHRDESNAVDFLDLEDIRKSLDGDEDAYKSLIRRHQQRISAMMWRFSRDKLIHEELVQDVFVETYLSLPTYKCKSPFRHWLARIATNTGYRYWKNRDKQEKIKTVSLADWDQKKLLTSDDISSQQAADYLHQLLEMLPPRDRLVLTLRYLQRNSIKETARLTRWSGSMVKVQTWRATNKLRKLFEENAPEALK